MFYIIENPYTLKLYTQFKNFGASLCLVSVDSVGTLKPNQSILVDEKDYQLYNSFAYQAKTVIVLGDAKTVVRSEALENIRYISKYQSYKNIQALIFDADFPLFFLTASKKNSLNDLLIQHLIAKYDLAYIFSLDFNPQSDFSLYDCLRFDAYTFELYKPIYVITNLNDALNPPVDALIDLFKKHSKKGRVLVHSTPIKGALDNSILNISNKIILIENDDSPHLKDHFAGDKPIDVIEVSENGKINVRESRIHVNRGEGWT